jgi:poly(3-hydroxybutyrate) depolymerase
MRAALPAARLRRFVSSELPRRRPHALRPLIALAFVLVLCPLAARAEPGKISKEVFESGGKKRAYYLYVPKAVAEAKTAAPLLVTLHGSGRDGRILVEHWKDVADREGLILAGPDSAKAGAADGVTWLIGRDGPDFLRDVVEDVKAKYAVNTHRVYLFGHSAGGGFAIYMAVTESEYFTAVFVHAGAVPEEGRKAFDMVKRKIPVGIVVGTEDPFFPLDAVRSTRDALKAHGIEAPLTEIKGHTHDYYGRSKDVNKLAWEFLKDKELAGEPKFTQYRYN